MKDNLDKENNKFILHIQSLIYIIILIVVGLFFLVYQFFNTSESLIPWAKKRTNQSEIIKNDLHNRSSLGFWVAPDIESISGSGLASQINYGKDLIAHTSKYLGPNGSISSSSNGMNCQNCHLEAGTKIYGNNYGSVASTFPKFRTRSGSIESIYKRINDCFERSLNGVPLDSMSSEMQAMKAYLLFLGKNVAKGSPAKGAGLKDITYLDRKADSKLGHVIYQLKCASCHASNGEGILNATGDEYTYPPLWGKHSYNDGAGLYRISNFAKYIKFNMPLGATFESPQLSDEEAWDLAAYVNSQPRPNKKTENDWPDISKKPIDHPFGPYADSFSEIQHKFGPFKPIIDFSK